MKLRLESHGNSGTFFFELPSGKMIKLNSHELPNKYKVFVDLINEAGMLEWDATAEYFNRQTGFQLIRNN